MYLLDCFGLKPSQWPWFMTFYVCIKFIFGSNTNDQNSNFKTCQNPVDIVWVLGMFWSFDIRILKLFRISIFEFHIWVPLLAKQISRFDQVRVYFDVTTVLLYFYWFIFYAMNWKIYLFNKLIDSCMPRWPNNGRTAVSAVLGPHLLRQARRLSYWFKH